MEVLVEECDANEGRRSSSASGQVDVEENVSLEDNKCLIADFNAHSNTSLMKKTCLRASSPLFHKRREDSLMPYN
jgi:hypothetical protein